MKTSIPKRPSDFAWLAVFGQIIVLELIARDNELLSNAADRYMRGHPWVTRTVVAITAAHLCNVTPERYDPWMMIVRLLRRLHHWLVKPTSTEWDVLTVAAQRGGLE